MEKTRILLCGFGRWGKIWFNTIINYNRDIIVGVVDPKGTDDFNIHVPCFKDIDDVDIEYTHAILAVPASLQLPLLKKLKKKIPEKNILVEKPVGGISNYGVSDFEGVFPGYVFLHDANYRYIKDNIKNDLGYIIKFQSIRGSMGPTLRKDCTVIEDYLIHDIYLYLDLFENEVDKLYPTDIITFYEFDNYPVSTIRVFGNRYPTFSMESSWNFPLKTRQWIIVGEKGSYIWDGEVLYFHNTHYKKIDGKDKYNNDGYELVQGEKKLIEVNSYLSTLTIELINFLEDKTDYSSLIKRTWRSIEAIYIIRNIKPIYFI